MTVESDNVLGIDVGGSLIKLWFRSRETVYITDDLANAKEPELLTFLKSVMPPGGEELCGIGIALPCTVLNENGIRRILSTCSKFGRLSEESHGGNIDLLEKSWRKALGTNVLVTDDAEAACFEVMTFLESRGNNRPFKNALILTLGTSVGLGLIIDGKPFRGMFTSRASHMILDCDGPWCANDAHRGCWKSLVGTEARRTLAMNMGLSDNLEDIIEEVTSGSKKAELFFSYYADNVARGLALVLNALPVECVVIAGGVAKAGDTLFLPIVNRLRRGDLIDADLVRMIEIVGAPDFSIAKGAQTYALSKLSLRAKSIT